VKLNHKVKPPSSPSSLCIDTAVTYSGAKITILRGRMDGTRLGRKSDTLCWIDGVKEWAGLNNAFRQPQTALTPEFDACGQHETKRK